MHSGQFRKTEHPTPDQRIPATKRVAMIFRLDSSGGSGVDDLRIFAPRTQRDESLPVTMRMTRRDTSNRRKFDFGLLLCHI
jgi:hypothetical protein